jgi:hypothetical protein
MSDGKDEKNAQQSQRDEIHSEEFQFVLKALLAAYQPAVEQDLNRAKNPDQLTKEAESKPPSCEDEIALANQIFGKFFTEEVAVRMLPPEGRRQLGAVADWRWCLQHIRCCIIFGWLVCRGPRTFRAFSYYVYRYWICIRETLGKPVSSPPTEEQRRDFSLLVDELAKAFKPYLTDQLATVEFPAGIPDEVINGKIDCREGLPEACAIFERLLTRDAAQALLGREAFDARSKDPAFWFCRCWCLCAICFGCCLARARTFVDVLWCLVYFFRCLRDCFQPLRCDLVAPAGCVEEAPGLVQGALAVEVRGTASGAFFDHYTLQWRKAQGQDCNDDTGWNNGGTNLFAYPGGGSSGTVPVVNGTLGWLNTTLLPADTYDIRVCVYSSIPNAARTCCCTQFALFKRLVWIDHVALARVQSPPGPFLGNTPLVDPNDNKTVVAVDCCVSVTGSAWVGDCQGRQLQCMDLRAAVGWQVGPEDLINFPPTLPLYNIPMLPFGPVCYTDPNPSVELQKRAQWNQLLESDLVAYWAQVTIDFLGSPITLWLVKGTCFDSSSGLHLGIVDSSGCPDTHHRCRSGKYTILLDVTDTLNNHYYDTQQVWFDNKPITAEFDGLEGLPGCTDLHLTLSGGFVPQGAPCNQCWPVNLLGIAYDEYIDESDLTPPSNNFDFYWLRITRQGGPSYMVPITPALCPPLFGPDPLQGTRRVGDPGTRCEPVPAVAGCPPPPAIPPKSTGVLTQLDLRIFDFDCAQTLAAPFAPPPGFALQRGTCCGYAFELYVQDNSWDDIGPGNCHNILTAPWAVCICNDLPPLTPAR